MNEIDIKNTEANVVKSLTERTVLLVYTAKVVSAHASRHNLSTSDLSNLIQIIYNTFQDLGPDPEDDAKKLVPAVSPKRSIFADYIICLEDGKKLKMLKRHLKSAYNMTPSEYRRKWGLPADYPMVAPNSVKQRAPLTDHDDIDGAVLNRRPDSAK